MKSLMQISSALEREELLGTSKTMAQLSPELQALIAVIDNDIDVARINLNRALRAKENWLSRIHRAKLAVKRREKLLTEE